MFKKLLKNCVAIATLAITVGIVGVSADNPFNETNAATTYTATIKKYNSTLYSTGVPDGNLTFGTASNNITKIDGNGGSATFTVSFAKGTSTLASIFNNSAGEIRLYRMATAGTPAKLTYTISGEYKITSVQLITTANSGASINGGTLFTDLNKTVTFSSDTTVVTIENLFVGASGGNLQTKEVILSYESTATNSLSSISVTAQPSNKSYYEGDSFDTTGMIVTAIYDPYSTLDVTSLCTFNPNPLTFGTTSVTVSYTENEVTKTTSVTGITVSEVVLNGISIKTSSAKLSFKLGEPFDWPGLIITADYNNEDIDLTSGFAVTGVDTMTLGSQNATVTFEGKTTSYSIDVTNQGASIGANTVSSDFFISEYVEGASGNNKALELFNGTGSELILSNYSLKIGVNGGAWSGELVLSGTLSNNDVFTIYNSGSTYEDILNNGDLSNNTICGFNGDDAIGLFNNGTLIDIIGVQGVDPGTGWDTTNPIGTIAGGTHSGSTVDRSLRRTATVTSPNTTFSWSEWEAYSDTASDLSRHVFYPNVTAIQQATAFANYVMTGVGLNAKGSCQAVFDELELEYGYMAADSKTEFNTNVDTLFVNARARMTYLDSYVDELSPQSGQVDSVLANLNGEQFRWLILAALVFIAGAVVYQFKIRRRV